MHESGFDAGLTREQAIDKLKLERMELRQKYEAIDEEIYEFEKKNKIEKNSWVIGKKYKYHNSYSCPEEESDYWWNYYAVTGMDESGNLKATEFSVDSNGKYNVRQENFHELLDEMIEITNEEFLQAKKKFELEIFRLLNV